LKKLQQIQVAERNTAMKKQKDFQSIDKIKIYNNKLFKISTISILLIFYLPLSYYFHFTLKTDAIFTHFYYIPIVLSSLWWTYKSIIISAFLSSILLVLQIVAPIHAEIYINITRVLMFLTVSIIISFLIEKRHLLEGKLRTYGKSLEQKIYGWEESYKKLEESANKPIILIGLKGKLLSLNNCAASNLGGKPKDYISKTLWDIFPKKVADERFKDHQKVIQSGRSNVKEITVCFIGIEYYYLARIQPIRNKSGDINSVLILDNDITDRKKAEKYLVELEEKYHIVFENTGTATMIVKEGRTISTINTQFEKLSGYSKKEIENKMKWTDFVIPEDLKRMKKYHIARRRAGEKPPTEYEFRMTDKKGNVKNIFLKIGMIPDTEKSIASFIDITERKQTEENVKNIKNELQMILDSVPALIIYKDTEGRIIRTNKTFADSLKVPIKDIVGKTTEELFPKGQAEKMRKDDREVIISGKPKRDIIQPYDTPDEVRWAITDKMPYKDKEGKVIGVISLSKDITVQRKSEQELKQTYQSLKKTMDATIQTVSKMIEAKDPYTAGHQQRVSQLTTAIAKGLNLSRDKIEGIRVASLIHDIGKISVPTEILSKSITLSDMEFNLIKGHSQIGYDILKSIDFSYPVAQIVLQHHERLNGSGYPNKLKDDEILLEARIIGVADVVEAMSSHRPYRPAFGIDKALEEISQNKCTLYDPVIVDTCLRIFKEKEFKFK
jgi:PAS domain S-box-containing protein